MGIDGCITRSPGEVLSFSVGNVLSISLDVSLGESEVEEEDFVCSFVQPDAEIVRLDVAVDEVSVVDVFNPGDHLINEHQHCLKRELAEGGVE